MFNGLNNKLFFEFLRFVKLLKPKIVVIENVRGILTRDNGYAKKRIEKLLNELGYNVIFNGGQRTLEADVEKIDTAKWELSNEYDPLFRLHREKFDQTGAKNLLVNVLHIDKGLNF